MPLPKQSANNLPEGLRAMLQKNITENLELPLQSKTSAEVLKLTSSEDCDAIKLSELLQRDQSLAGHVLGIANSAAYAPKEPIVSLQQAVSRLGVGVIAEISIAISLKGKVFDVPGYGTLIRDMWIHAAASAVYAKEIARVMRCSVEGAFMCALLHDVGRPLVLQNLVDLARSQNATDIPAGIVQAAMNEFHEMVGDRMVKHWELPEWMGDVVGHHHDYSQAGEGQEVAMIVALADSLATWALDEDSAETEFDSNIDVVDDLNLYGDEISVLTDLRDQILEGAEAFL
jgi:putative nucleotidyltransferase with HDIG domain